MVVDRIGSDTGVQASTGDLIMANSADTGLVLVLVADMRANAAEFPELNGN